MTWYEKCNCWDFGYFDQNWTFVRLNRWKLRSVRSRNNSHAFVTFVLFNLFLLSSFTWNQTNMKIWKQKYNICIIICFIRRSNKDKNILFHQNWPFLDLLCILGFSRNDHRFCKGDEYECNAYHFDACISATSQPMLTHI